MAPDHLLPAEADTVPGHVEDGNVMVWHGSLGPSAGAPARRPGSLRRTSTVDIRWPEGVGGVLWLDGRARDLHTGADGKGRIVASSSTRVVVADGAVVSLTTDPLIPMDGLLGVPARRFRRAIAARLPELADDGSLLGLLLDEIPVTTLISGHATMRSGRQGGGDAATGGPVAVQIAPRPPTGASTGAAREPLDVCIGWARGGFMAANAERGFHPQSYEAVTVPPLTLEDDPLSWHEMPMSLPPTSLRRNRRLDLFRSAHGTLEIEGVFRDQYYEQDGRVTGIHEYQLTASIDPVGARLVAIDVSPRVLPGPECPGADRSAQRLVDCSLDEIRSLVRAEFTGTTTCTHLNDQLRAMGDLHALISYV